ncbi:MAG: ribbon-helix-helix protein, CopG family [Halalkalicoccus sp.]|nr:ribbon-helix-helix protein, CopG family [Halalkalicoccus sp.]
MERLTVRVPEDLLEEVERVAAADDVSQSEAARQLLRRGTAYDDLKQENERLRDQLAATNRRVDQHTELVEYVREEREVDRRRQERMDAPAWRRAKWWLLGRDREKE